MKHRFGQRAYCQNKLLQLCISEDEKMTLRDLAVARILRVLAASLIAAMPLAGFISSSAQEPAAPASEEADNRIYVCQPDGSGMKLLVEKSEYRMQGSPAWSQDGK